MLSNEFGGTVGQEGVDGMFIIICSFIIFTMQSGFGLFESGMVSRRSEANVIVKNMIDVSYGSIAYWFVGFGFSFGPNTKDSKTMSGEGYFMTDVELNSTDSHIYTKYFFQLSFAATATTIVSGAVAERIKLSAYMIFVIINTGLIYVFPCHWIWDSKGWLYGKAKDYAGSCDVHMAGGAAAFAVALFLGPRLGRFTKDKKHFRMASPTNVVLGTFFLWWGWIGFNCGSQFAISGIYWKVVSRVAVVTMNGAVGGNAGAVVLNLMFHRWRRYLVNIEQFTTGILGGLVSINASADVIRPWEGLVIGFIGGLVAIGFINLLKKLKVDDPVGCVGIHWGSGLWGMIATGFFAEQRQGSDQLNGVFRGGSGELLGWNLIAAVVVTVWSFGLSAIVFAILKYTMGIRLSDEEEIRGSDDVEHDIRDDYDPHEYNHAFGMKVDALRLRHHNLTSNDSGPNGITSNDFAPQLDNVNFKETEETPGHLSL